MNYYGSTPDYPLSNVLEQASWFFSFFLGGGVVIFYFWRGGRGSLREKSQDYKDCTLRVKINFTFFVLFEIHGKQIGGHHRIIAIIILWPTNKAVSKCMVANMDLFGDLFEEKTEVRQKKGLVVWKRHNVVICLHQTYSIV